MSETLRFTFTEPQCATVSGADRWSMGANRWAAVVRPLVRGALRSKAPVGKGDPATGRKAGAFKNSITYRTTSVHGSIRVQFGSPLPYTPFIVDGTKPHVIVPRNARVLHFRTAAGASVFTRRVNHPGTRANPFASRAVLPLLPEIQESFSTIMRDALGGGP